MRIAGVNVTDRPLDARARMGFLAQDTLLYPRHTVRETLSLFAQLQGLPAEQAGERTDEWIHRLHLQSLDHRLVGTLSSGERQRANLARALVHEPPVIILDEPTTALDPETVDLLLQTIRALRDEGRAVLLCTHALSDAELVVDRAILIHAGRAIAGGPVKELMQETSTTSLTGAFLSHVRGASASAVAERS
jgi:sodium transport system ATP-binding protein